MRTFGNFLNKFMFLTALSGGVTLPLQADCPTVWGYLGNIFFGLKETPSPRFVGDELARLRSWAAFYSVPGPEITMDETGSMAYADARAEIQLEGDGLYVALADLSPAIREKIFSVNGKSLDANRVRALLATVGVKVGLLPFLDELLTELGHSRNLRRDIEARLTILSGASQTYLVEIRRQLEAFTLKVEILQMLAVAGSQNSLSARIREFDDSIRLPSGQHERKIRKTMSNHLIVEVDIDNITSLGLQNFEGDFAVGSTNTKIYGRFLPDGRFATFHDVGLEEARQLAKNNDGKVQVVLVSGRDGRFYTMSYFEGLAIMEPKWVYGLFAGRTLEDLYELHELIERSPLTILHQVFDDAVQI